ncbi:Integral membrane protein [Colletotrichum sp. SAR11_59]|nr:Integral membrane protein [Colletotrichum sp. SAR11_59]
MPNFNPAALTDRRNDVFRGYTEFFESQPGDKSQSLRLDVLDNLLRLFKDSNMNDVYLQETADFLSHPWPKLQQNISHLLQVEERLELMREIKSSAVIQQYLHGWNTPCLNKLRMSSKPDSPEEETPETSRERKLPRTGQTMDSSAATSFSACSTRSQSSRPDTPTTPNKSKKPERDQTQAELAKKRDNYRWDKAQIGLQPIEKLWNGLRLRLHVFQDSKLRKDKAGNCEFNWKRDMMFDLDPNDVFKPFLEADGQDFDIRLMSSTTQRIVRSGDEITITAEDPAHAPNWDLFDLNWRLCLMAALLGAGEVPEQIIPEPVQGPDGQMAPTDQDLDTDTVINTVIYRLENLTNASAPSAAEDHVRGAQPDGANNGRAG